MTKKRTTHSKDPLEEIFSRQYSAHLLNVLLNPGKLSKEEQLEAIDDYLESGADPNLRINDMDDRIMHLCALEGRADVMELLLKKRTESAYEGDPNIPNIFHQRPLRAAALLAAAKDSPQEKEKIQLIRLLLKNGADPFIKDKANNSDFFYLDNYYDVVLDEMFPSSKNWTIDQKETRIQCLWLTDFCNGDVKPYLKDEPDPSELVERFKKFNALYDEHGKYAGQRSIDDLVYWTQEMFAHMTRAMYYAPLITNYGMYQGAIDHTTGKAPPLIIDLKYHLTSVLSYLPYKHDDMPDGQFILTYFSKEFAQANFGENKKLNIPAVSPAKIVECLGAWQDKQYVISQQIDNVEPINFGSVIDAPVTAPNGWIINPIKNSPHLKDEAKTLHNCMGGYLTACTYRGAHFFTLRKDPAEPAYVYGITIDRTSTIQRFAEPVRYNNLEPPKEDVKTLSADIAWFERSLLDGTIPGLSERSYSYYQDIANKKRIADQITLEVGYNPIAEDAVERSHRAVEVFGNNLHDMIRFRRAEPEVRFKNMDMMNRFQKTMDAVGLRPPGEAIELDYKPQSMKP